MIPSPTNPKRHAMRHLHFPHSLTFWHEPESPDARPRRCLLEVVRTLKGCRIEADAGRLFVEVNARGKAPTWREVPKEGPTYREILNSQRGLMEDIARFNEEERFPD